MVCHYTIFSGFLFKIFINNEYNFNYKKFFFFNILMTPKVYQFVNYLYMEIFDVYHT